jgi:subtilisin family serine protease
MHVPRTLSSRRFRGAVIAALFALLPVAASAQKVSADAFATARNDGEARVVVMLQPTPAAQAAAAKGIRLHPAVKPDVDAVLRALPAAGRARVTHRFERVPAFAMRADAATLARLQRDPRVAKVDLDVGGSGSGEPDYASVLNHVHQLRELGVGGAGMKVGVVDTGIDTNHADFLGRIVGERCFCTVGTGCCPNGGTSQSGAGSAEDDQGHGTNVAGIIGGDGTIAPRGALPQVQLVAVKVIDRNNRFQSTADVVAALDWLAANHADIDAVNLSLGTDTLFAGDCDNSTAWTQALAVSVNNLRALGAVVVVSSGNQGNSNAMSAPSCVSTALSTGATWDFTGPSRTFLGCTETSTEPLKPTCFTNRSATTDLYAAGAFVTAPGFNGATSTFGGTSQAAPMAAACAVALKQAAPASTVAQRMAAMTLSPTRITDTVSARSYPFLNCRDALRILNPAMFEPIPVNGSRPLLVPRPQATKPAPLTRPQAGNGPGRAPR